jgi:hypothetical protein
MFLFDSVALNASMVAIVMRTSGPRQDIPRARAAPGTPSAQSGTRAFGGPALRRGVVLLCPSAVGFRAPPPRSALSSQQFSFHHGREERKASPGLAVNALETPVGSRPTARRDPAGVVLERAPGSGTARRLLPPGGRLPRHRGLSSGQSMPVYEDNSCAPVRGGTGRWRRGGVIREWPWS